MSTSHYWRWSWRWGILGLAGLWVLLPLGWAGWSSVQGDPWWIHYQTVGQDPETYRTLGHSVLLAVGSSSVGLGLGIPAAWSLLTLPRRWVWLLISLLVWIRFIPPVVLMVPLYRLLAHWQLVDTWMGLILWQGTLQGGFVAAWLWSFWQRLDPAWLEASVVEGYTVAGAWARIIVPLSWAEISTCGLMGMLFSWHDFVSVVVLSGSQTRPFSLYMLAQLTTEGLNWGAMSGLAVGSALGLAILLSLWRWIMAHAVGSETR